MSTVNECPLICSEHGERLARIETKIDTLLEHRADHEHRLRAIERERWLHRGGLGVLMFVIYKLGLPWMMVK